MSHTRAVDARTYREVLKAQASGSPSVMTRASVEFALSQVENGALTLLAAHRIDEQPNRERTFALRQGVRDRGHGFVRLLVRWRSAGSAGSSEQEWLVVVNLSGTEKRRLVEAGLVASIFNTAPDCNAVVSRFADYGLPGWDLQTVTFPPQSFIQSLAAAHHGVM